MRLYVLSDLHLERAPFAVPQVDADVVILGGDIATGDAGVRWAKQTFPDRPVIYLSGNHEFYGQSLPGLTSELKTLADGSNLHVLENDAVVIDGVRFLGCTLWSDFQLAGRDRREYSMNICARAVNDYKLIEATGKGRMLKPQDTLALHQQSRAWLREQLATPFDGRTVVVTHHAPLIEQRPSNPLLEAIGGAFASDLSELMGADATELWLFGHVHRCVETNVAGTRVISNQRGYPQDPTEGFDPELVVTV